MQTAVATQPQYEVTEADKRRQKQIAEAWKAYSGEFEDQLQVMPNGVNPNANSNRCEPIVFSGVNFLFGKPVEITVEQGAPPDAQQFLDDTWGRTEKRMPLLQDLATSGAIAGQAFLRIVPNKDASKFNLTVVDPLTVSVQTSPQDCKTVLLYCIEYSIEQKQAGTDKPVQVYFHEEIQRIDPDGNAQYGMPDDDDTWSIQCWTRVGDKGAWQPVVDSGISWGYPFPPIFTCQNRSNPHDFWGLSDLTADLIQQNRDLNLTQSNAQKIGIIQSRMMPWAKGTNETVLDVAPDHILQLPPEAEMGVLNLQADLANTLNFLANLRANMDEQSAVPSVALGRQESLPKGQVSGITMELLFMPLLAKTEMKRCRYGELIIDVSLSLLQLAGFSPDIDVSLIWKQPLPHDDLQSAQAIQALQAAGVSIQTSLQMFGIDAAQEEERRNAEAAKQQVAFSRGQGMPPSPQSPPQQPGQAPAPDDQQQEQGGQQ